MTPNWYGHRAIDLGRRLKDSLHKNISVVRCAAVCTPFHPKCIPKRLWYARVFFRLPWFVLCNQKSLCIYWKPPEAAPSWNGGTGSGIFCGKTSNTPLHPGDTSSITFKVPALQGRSTFLLSCISSTFPLLSESPTLLLSCISSTFLLKSNPKLTYPGFGAAFLFQ